MIKVLTVTELKEKKCKVHVRSRIFLRETLVVITLYEDC